MLCYAVLCYAVLCCAVLCYAMLCCAMLCYAMLCYAIAAFMHACHLVRNTPRELSRVQWLAAADDMDELVQAVKQAIQQCCLQVRLLLSPLHST